ncbi:ABC transporter ATP-binding protein [Lachnobacterium bovis]|uniref:Energy-coupling factor transport system ATP-binding protein n=1 Tax=Lachnobacterium bovis DSM 14045 TaxID=1122142 RepID=A0A1H3KHF6_9FIRM|nr:ABC transporter ATP-binding protein [Lachnobacterium bovis]SDY51205.1 energy-coupling factor transport system ATP-binding protein [Lachnobacterium bovis DSM 14045]
MIEFENVSFKYANNKSDKANLYDINLKIKSGEFVVFTGESGCGKTTFTRILNGLVPNFFQGELTGNVKIDNVSIIGKKVEELGRIIGSVFQNPRSQFFNVDTDSELAFAAENISMDTKEIISRMKDVTSQLKLEKLRSRNIFELSGGEKQQIACGSVAVMHPDIVVLDEPSSNLDRYAIENLRQVLVKWKAEGKTIVISEHRLYYLKDLLDEIFILKKGRIDEQYTRDELIFLSDKEISEKGLRTLDESCVIIKDKTDKEKNIKQDINKHNNEDSTVNCIEIEDLEYEYKRKDKALCLKKFEIVSDGIVAIIGKNGVGKSTFLKCLCGVYKAKHDRVYKNGKLWPRKQRLKDSYLVMQDVNHQLFTESVLEEVMISMDAKMSDTEKKEKAIKILKRFKLEEFANAHPMSLSGGQKQRVAIASCIAAERKFILLDEPTSGLDKNNMHLLAKELKFLKNKEKTIFVVTHDYEFINECCDEVVKI